MSFTIIRPLPSVQEVMEMYPLSEEMKAVKAQRDLEIRRVFEGTDSRMLVIVGPCSADYEKSVLEYVSKRFAPKMSIIFILYPILF